MARSLLLLSSVALLAMIARADTSESDSMWSDGSSTSGNVPVPTNPFPMVNGCVVNTNNARGTAITVDLADVARSGDVQVSKDDYSFTFSPCQQRSLTDCSDKDGKPVAVEGNLVVKNKNACTEATDVYNLAAQEAIIYNAIKGVWTITLQNGVNNFQVNVMCDPQATAPTATAFDQQAKSLTIADYRACAQDTAALHPVAVTEGCAAAFTYFGKDVTSTLDGFQQWFDQQAATPGTTLPDVRVQSCTAADFAGAATGPKGCTGNGFFAFTGANDQCVVLNQRAVTFYPENQTFTSTYFNNGATARGFAAQAVEDAKTVQVSCGPDNAYVAEESNINFFSFTSPTVCGTAATAPPATTTAAPTAAPEKKGLSAGAVAGIVIGVIAVIVLIAVAFVCFRSKSRSAEEGEYNRV